MCTLKAMMSHHQRILQEASAPKHNATELAHGMFGHIETHFQSTNLRLKSLEKRMENIIALVSSRYVQFVGWLLESKEQVHTNRFLFLVFSPCDARRQSHNAKGW